MEVSFMCPETAKRICKERDKAQALKRTPWWKQQLRKGRCHDCGNLFQPDQLSIDHVAPLARGGKSTKRNTVPACHASQMHKAAILSFVLLPCLISGCNLGHRIYKDDFTETRVDRWKECITYEKYVDKNKKHAAKKKYEKKSLVSNICTDDGEENSFSFGIVEFDDYGTRWDREQLSRVKEEIKEISKAQQKDKIKNEGILLVVFVHGWRHNASEGSSHLLEFRKLAEKIADSNKICNKASNIDINNDSSLCESRPYVFAVYLSWRGDSLGLTNTYTRDSAIGRRLRDFQLLTFWDRKDAALRVAGTSMTETLLVLLDAADTADRERRKNYKNDISKFAKSKSLIIGHSFGARVVEHAVSQAFIAKRFESRRIFEDPNLGIVPIKEDLQKVNQRMQEMNSEIERKIGERDEKKKEIKSIELAIQKIKPQLMSLPTSDEELNAYRAFEIDTMESISDNACRTYEPRDVVNCATRQDSVPDFRQLAICSVRKIQCLYESYICSIEAALEKGRTDTASSSRSCERRMIDLETGYLGDKSPPSKGDDISLWYEFLDDLKEYAGMIPPLKEVADISDLEFAKKILRSDDDLKEARPFYQTHFLLEKLRDWDIVPNANFAPRHLPNDPTDGVEDELIYALKEAEQHVKNLVEEETNHFESMKEREKLRERRLELGEQRKELKRKIAKYTADIDKIKEDRNDLENEANKLFETIRYELDTFLRPPANLVILLNPATEALSAQNLINAMCTIKDIGKEYAPERSPIRPWAISITSENDIATKLGFPFGVGLSHVYRLAAGREYPSDGQSVDCDWVFGKYGDLLSRTAGHLRGIHSHKIEKKDGNHNSNEDEIEFEFEIAKEKFVARKLHLREKNDRLYWIMTAPPEVIDGHDDIFNEGIQNIFLSLLKHSEVFLPICPKYDHKTGRCVNKVQDR